MPFMYDDNKGGITPGANRHSSPGVSQRVSRVDAMLCDTTRDKLLALRAERLALHEDLLGTPLYLASPASACLTGQTIAVYGGDSPH